MYMYTLLKSDIVNYFHALNIVLLRMLLIRLLKSKPIFSSTMYQLYIQLILTSLSSCFKVFPLQQQQQQQQQQMKSLFILIKIFIYLST